MVDFLGALLDENELRGPFDHVSSDFGAILLRDFQQSRKPTPLPPFRVVQVVPIDSNTLRIFFSKQPRLVGPLGTDDALNRLNWTLSLVIGPGKTPEIEKMENAQPQPDLVGPISTGLDGNPINGAIPTAWSIDLRTARRIILETTYLVVASSLMIAVDGDAMAAAPNDRGESPGIFVLRPRVIQRSSATRACVDIFYDFFGDRSAQGAFNLNPRNDLDTHGGISALKKKIIRRIITTPGGFFHLPQYGVGLRNKGPFDPTSLAEIRLKIRDQVIQEREVADVSVAVATFAPGVLIIDLRVKTTIGTQFSLNIESSADEVVVI